MTNYTSMPLYRVILITHVSLKEMIAMYAFKYKKKFLFYFILLSSPLLFSFGNLLPDFTENRSVTKETLLFG